MPAPTEQSPFADDFAERLTLVRRGLLGVEYWISGYAYLLPFCDYLKLLLPPGSLAISLWARPEGRPEFSTRPEIAPDFPPTYAVQIGHDECWVCCHRVYGDATREDHGVRELLVRLFGHPDFAEAVRGATFGARLRLGLMRSKPNVQASVDLRPPEPTGVSDFAWDAICTAVLAGLDGVLASSQHGSFESSTRASLSSTFAFAFVAGLDGKRSLLRPVPIFSTEQSKFLAGDQPLASNPAPEAQFATAFALEAAQAAKEETIGLFGPLPRQRTEGLNDSVRLLANHHRVFIPIHIEGVPWLVLILFLSGPEHQRWYHTFHYYRDVVPRIGAALRTVTKSTYLHVLTRLLAVEIDDREQEALDERFNRQSRVLTQYFPFPQVELTKFSPHGIKLTLPRQDPVSIEFRSNRHFQRATALAYDLLDTTSISDALNRTVVQALDRDVSFHQEMDYQAHTLFNEIPSIQLEAALNSRRENLAGKARDFVTAARAKLSILEVSLSIPFAEEEEEDRLADFTSVIVLLRWFETIFAAMGGKTCKLTIAGADITLATSRQRADVFTVLWNLWHNAAKIYARSTTNEYSVTTAPADGGLSITFRNEGVMPMDYVRYLTNADGNPPVSKKRGLRIVKAKVAKLGWPLPTINVTSKSTSVTLVVNNPSISPHERKTAGG